MTAPIRRHTRTVVVGGVPIGSRHPIVIQSMLKSPPSDVEAAVRETARLAEAGCGIIRLAVPDSNALAPLKAFCKSSPLPVVADIHFDPRLAVGAIEAGVSKVRLNPGNLKDEGEIRRIVSLCKDRGIPIRVGANSGSIRRRDGSDDRPIAQALVSGVIEYCQLIESFGFHDIVVSLKASDVLTNTLIYREVALRTDYPLHLGLTATGPADEGRVKSDIALGSLLVDGIGDTIRVSLTAPPIEEVRAACNILRGMGILCDRPIILSCPTCGRCEVDIAAAVEEVRSATAGICRPLRIAVMGCVVNGPGEAADCDFGVACGRGKAVLFASGKPVETVSAAGMIPALLKLIERSENIRKEPSSSEPL
ncbi:MAG: flavodoxin-dependent (E)-4-hydroxy-3-methylbut-2-enyl-diphosphate synthase [Candidatus Brocadiia bacterium]